MGVGGRRARPILPLATGVTHRMVLRFLHKEEVS
jgi:hypothetical protein